MRGSARPNCCAWGEARELAASLVEQLEPVAQARTIDLRCERNGTVMVNGDAGWLQRLLLNLLDNAIKFTREGGHVVPSVSREAGRARIDVRDTGIGMPPDVTPHVFERFFQADPARSSGKWRRCGPQSREVDRRSSRRHDYRAEPRWRGLNIHCETSLLELAY
jgi:signal transduction histidine kinase